MLVPYKCQVWSAAKELTPLCLFEEVQYLPKSTAQNLEAADTTPHLQSGLLLQITFDNNLLKNVSYTLTHTCIFCLTGHGFKLSPVVGKVIAELVMEENPSYDLSPFRLDRF